mmetsp:Transcript_4170/g.9445  ORF Transcript_4170/g.9445 Transcript_4170/m.9445 type:complete len:313 (+) Transcript_4170:1007-1945(+)
MYPLGGRLIFSAFSSFPLFSSFVFLSSLPWSSPPAVVDIFAASALISTWSTAFLVAETATFFFVGDFFAEACSTWSTVLLLAEAAAAAFFFCGVLAVDFWGDVDTADGSSLFAVFAAFLVLMFEAELSLFVLSIFFFFAVLSPPSFVAVVVSASSVTVGISLRFFPNTALAAVESPAPTAIGAAAPVAFFSMENVSTTPLNCECSLTNKIFVLVSSTGNGVCVMGNKPTPSPSLPFSAVAGPTVSMYKSIPISFSLAGIIAWGKFWTLLNGPLPRGFNVTLASIITPSSTMLNSLVFHVGLTIVAYPSPYRN